MNWWFSCSIRLLLIVSLRTRPFGRGNGSETPIVGRPLQRLSGVTDRSGRSIGN
jgi:hypothetical protein